MLRITYDDNGTAHEDITLQLGEMVSVSDSYYLLLSLDEDIAPAVRARTCLAQMITGWVNRLKLCPPVCYLLVELHDEFTRWIRCQRIEEQFELQLGWSTESGHDIDPIHDAARDEAPADWQESPNSEVVRLTDVELLALQRSQAALRAQEVPRFDPTPLFEHFRGAYSTQLLTVAVAHFNLFARFSNSADGSLTVGQLQQELQLASRPFQVLITALKAMGLLEQDGERLRATPVASEHLTPGNRFDVSHYIGLAATSPDVQGMVERLVTNTPYGLDVDENGTAFIYRDGVPSAMEQSELARHFTLSLAGRARNVAPVLAEKFRLSDATHLLDVGGGSGIYSVAYVARNHRLRATVLDRPEVLSVAQEFTEEFGVADRIELLAADMFAEEFPAADVVLLSNLLHDWDIPECRKLIQKSVAALPTGGRLLIHDVFLDDDHAGPLPITLYSAALFSLTEGRAYSVAEYTKWMQEYGLEVSGPVETLVHCGVLCGRKLR